MSAVAQRRGAVAGAIAEAPAPEGRRERRRAAEDANEAAEAAGAVEPVPETAAAGYERALAAMRAENWLEAELELEQLTLEHPEYPGPHVNLALVYLNDERRDDARAALERALSVEPGHAAANTQLGILLREDGEFADAEAAYRRALETSPDYALAHYNLAVLLDIYLRRTAEALEHYEAYQATLAQPNETVGRWIIDLRRRVGNADAARVAQGGWPMRIAPTVVAAAGRGERCRPRARCTRKARAARERRRPRARRRRRRAACCGGAAPRAPAAAPAATSAAAERPAPRVMDSLDLGTTSITGNAELPKVLYIVPWKKSDLGDSGRAPREHFARRGARARRSRSLRTASELLRFPVRGARRGVRDGGL